MKFTYAALLIATSSFAAPVNPFDDSHSNNPFAPSFDRQTLPNDHQDYSSISNLDEVMAILAQQKQNRPLETYENEDDDKTPEDPIAPEDLIAPEDDVDYLISPQDPTPNEDLIPVDPAPNEDLIPSEDQDPVTNETDDSDSTYQVILSIILDMEFNEAEQTINKMQMEDLLELISLLHPSEEEELSDEKMAIYSLMDHRVTELLKQSESNDQFDHQPDTDNEIEETPQENESEKEIDEISIPIPLRRRIRYAMADRRNFLKHLTRSHVTSPYEEKHPLHLEESSA